MKNIPVAGPWITELETSYVTDAATHAWFADHAMYHQRFEAAFADAIGIRYAMALPSCTSALHLILAALGIGSGDEVIVPDATWIASSAPISYVGATPVFVDIDPLTWCMDAGAFERAINEKTKAAIVVDLYGGMPDWEALETIASARNIPLIEDAAEAVGSRYKGRMAGGFGVAGAFSFHGSKTMTTGEGGMLVTDDKVLFERAQFLRDHGRPTGDRFFQNTEVGFKYKMSAMQAAMGLAQTERLDELVERKQAIFGWYKEAVAGRGDIVLNHQPTDVFNSYWMVTAIVDKSLGIEKLDLMESLSKQGIDSRPFFHPLSSLHAYEKNSQAIKARDENKVAYDVSSRGINLPSGFQLDEETVKYVCDIFCSILDEKNNEHR